MVEGFRLVTRQHETLRPSFHGDRLQAQQMAGITEKSPADRADATGATGDESAD